MDIRPQISDKVRFVYTFNTGKTSELKGVVAMISGEDFTIKVCRPSMRSFGPRIGGTFTVKLAAISAVLEGPRSETDHSDKGNETLSLMGTEAKDWGLAAIRWEKRMVPTEVWVLCPSCGGSGEIGTVEGKTVNSCTAWNAGARDTIRPCPTCVRGSRNRKYYHSKEVGFCDHHGEKGLVRETKVIEREIGIVQWATGTRFDSRFFSGMRCGLCGKVVPSGRFVPVTGKGADGVVHGMWVGEDCARKFFGVKNFKEDQVVDREVK